MALAIIEGGKAATTIQAQASGERKTIKAPEPYVFNLYRVYAYPTRGDEPINPDMSARFFNRAGWHPDGFGLMLVVGRGRAFGYLAWYSAVRAAEVVPTVPDREALICSVRWTAPPFCGMCNPAHLRKLELSEVGVFRVEAARVDQFFPHLAPGNSYAVSDISIANRIKIVEHAARH
jgi:hypothetical protein